MHETFSSQPGWDPAEKQIPRVQADAFENRRLDEASKTAFEAQYHSAQPAEVTIHDAVRAGDQLASVPTNIDYSLLRRIVQNRQR